MKRVTAAVSMLLLTSTLLFGCGSNGGGTQTPQDENQTENAADQTTDEAEKDTETGTETDTEAATDTEEDADASDEQSQEAALADGVYTAEFHTDSSMFHVNEACDGTGTLTVTDGQMYIHISLTSKNIVNLYPGLAEDAQKEDAVLLEPTTDVVTYDDGTSEEVNGFDVPVPALDEEFDLALIGTKGTWYDHRVSVTNAVPAAKDGKNNACDVGLAAGSYTVELTFEGGSGRAQIESPAHLTSDGIKMTATVTWSSPNYDYMIVNGEKYLPVNTEGNSVFEIPVETLDVPIKVIGDTVAMSKPHEIEYTLTFHSDTLQEEN